MSAAAITPEAQAKRAARHTRNLASQARRVKREGYGRNQSASYSTARFNFDLALRAVLALEDELGVDAAAAASDRLTAARQAAQEVGLLSPADVLDIEARALG